MAKSKRRGQEAQSSLAPDSAGKRKDVGTRTRAAKTAANEAMRKAPAAGSPTQHREGSTNGTILDLDFPSDDVEPVNHVTPEGRSGDVEGEMDGDEDEETDATEQEKGRPSSVRVPFLQAEFPSSDIESDTESHQVGEDEEQDEDAQLAKELELERQQMLREQGLDSRSDASSTQERESANEDSDDDESEADIDDMDEDNSEDEWRPPDEEATRPSSRSRRKPHTSHRLQADEDEEEEEDLDRDDEMEEDELVKSLRGPKSNGTGSKKRKSASEAQEAKKLDKRKRRNDQEDLESNAEDHEEFDEEEAQAQAEIEAAAAWEQVRKRKEAASLSGASAATSKETGPSQPPSLTSWLGKGPSAASSVSELAAALPMPTTCDAAQIVDRNSLFISYVYPLTTTSSAYIATLLSHLTRVVHPTVKVELLPPQFANAPANKRGSSHDMYAYRVLQLKRGRNGLSGPDDYSLVEEKEDDGERWGGDRVLKVAREEGASDALVIVSRWYGGELLGPVRFEHIEKAARAALEKHMQQEEVDEFRLRIQHLDKKIDELKSKLADATSDATTPTTSQSGQQKNNYPDLDLQKGQRIWLARQKQYEILQKRIQNLTTAVSNQNQNESLNQNTTEEVTNVAEEQPNQAHTTNTDIPSPNVHDTNHTDVSQLESEPAGNPTTVKPEPNPETAETHTPAATSTTTAEDTSSEPRVKAEPVESALPISVETHHTTTAATSFKVKKEDPDAEPIARFHDVGDAESNSPRAGEEDLTGWDDLS